MLNNKELKCIEDNFSDVIQKNDYFVKTKQWIVCKFDVDTKPIAIYHNSGKLYKLMGVYCKSKIQKVADPFCR